MIRIIQDTPALAWAGKDPIVLHKLADLRVQVETSKMLSYRVGWMQDQGLQPNMEASMAKLFATELEQRVGYAAMEVTGLYGQALPRSSRALLQGVVPRRYMGNIPSTIAAGSSEINRNIMATRGLGLPR